MVGSGAGVELEMAVEDWNETGTTNKPPVCYLVHMY